jgi:hypothetical protein
MECVLIIPLFSIHSEFTSSLEDYFLFFFFFFYFFSLFAQAAPAQLTPWDKGIQASLRSALGTESITSGTKLPILDSISMLIELLWAPRHLPRTKR